VGSAENRFRDRIHIDNRQRPTERLGSTLSYKTLGVRGARKRVARPMREAGLFGCGGGRRRKARTTLCAHRRAPPPAPDLVKRNFAPESPDRLWVADITYVYSRRIVGWSMTNSLKTDLVIDALNLAIYTRRPKPGLIHHSDRG
jgi:putative transposase